MFLWHVYFCGYNTTNHVPTPICQKNNKITRMKINAYDYKIQPKGCGKT
jgi:hypothetical protein